MDTDILDDLPGKLVSGYYLDKISINGKEFEVYKKEEKYLVLLCKNGIIEDGGDGIPFYFLLDLMKNGY